VAFEGKDKKIVAPSFPPWDFARRKMLPTTREEGMADEGSRSEKIRIKIEQHTLTGGLWCAAWLFTIGFLHLNFWRGVLAIILWPYYIGAHFSAVAR
jgi:hypothetical protein